MSYYHSCNKNDDYYSNKKHYKKYDDCYYTDKKDKHCSGCNQIVHVNVNNYDKGTDSGNGNNTAIPSAFRAISNTTVRLNGALERIKIFYPIVQYDLVNEYNAATSTFIPKDKGIYSLIASLSAARDASDTNEYILFLELRVNGKVIATAQNYIGPAAPFTNQVFVTADIQLQANDKVEVFAQSSRPVTTFPETDFSSAAFSATRLPSPN